MKPILPAYPNETDFERGSQGEPSAALLLAGLHDANLAHAVAITESGAIPVETSKVLLTGLLELRDVEIRPGPAGLYRSMEHLLEQRLGAVASWMHADRSGQEAVGVAFLLTIRSRVLELARRHLSFADAAITVADRNRETVIYHQNMLVGGPVSTLGHALLTFVYPVFRDLERLQHCYRAFNSSPAGAGHFTGTCQPIDRERLRALLGFDEIRAHSRDALWQADAPIELMAAIVALLVNLNRLADDLRKWTMSAPIAESDVSWMRGMTGELLAKVPILASLGKNCESETESSMFIATELATAFDGASRAIEVLTSLVTSTTLANLNQFAQIASPALSNTDLAKLLSSRRGVDHATALEIVRAVERLAAKRALPSAAVTPRLLDEVAYELIGRNLELSPEELASAIDPARIVAARRGAGGAAPERVLEMITECRARLVRENLWVSTATQRLARSREQLLAQARQRASA